LASRSQWSQARFRWALCAVWSRSFHLQQGSWRVLAPAADFFNHAVAPVQPSAHLEVVTSDERVLEATDEARAVESAAAHAVEGQLGTAPEVAEGEAAAEAAEEAAGAADATDAADSTDATVRFVANRDVPASSVVEIDYGARANAEMVTTHGFGLASNEHESLPLSLAPTATDPIASVKAKILAAGNLSAPYALSVKALRTDSDLLVALRVLVASTDEIRQYAAAFRGQPISARNERRWRVLLRQQTEALLRERVAYSSAEADETELHALPPHASGRLVAALVTRLGEKRLLASVLSELGRMRADADDEEENRSVRAQVASDGSDGVRAA